MAGSGVPDHCSRNLRHPWLEHGGGTPHNALLRPRFVGVARVRGTKKLSGPRDAVAALIRVEERTGKI